MNNFARFLIGPIRRMSRIIRYSTRLRLFDETVSSHSYYVVLYSVILSDILIESGYEVDKDKVIMRSLLHDCDESVSGDIIRIFRQKLGKELEALTYESTRYILQDLPSKIKIKYLWEWINKFKDLEGLIVSVADDISGLVYCREQLQLGNKSFQPIYDSYLKGVLNKINKTPLKFLKEDLEKLEKEKFVDNQ